MHGKRIKVRRSVKKELPYNLSVYLRRHRSQKEVTPLFVDQPKSRKVVSRATGGPAPGKSRVSYCFQLTNHEMKIWKTSLEREIPKGMELKDDGQEELGSDDGWCRGKKPSDQQTVIARDLTYSRHLGSDVSDMV
jgi:hypothetical protein